MSLQQTTLDQAKPRSICFLPQYQRRRKCFFFLKRDQNRHAEKDQALHITFSQSDWFIVQNERSDWLLQQDIATTRILNRAKGP